VLRRSEYIYKWLDEKLEIDDTRRKEGKQEILLTLRKEGLLEAELLAAGFTTKGDVKQQQSLENNLLEYRWNCAFTSAGIHEMAVVLRVIHANNTLPLGTIEQKVKVVRFDHATQHQVRLFAITAGIAVFISSIVTIVTNIHSWFKP
jgi:hypothetical protein